MNAHEAIIWFLLVAMLLPALLGSWLVAFALFRGSVERASARISRRPATCTLVGLVILVPIIALILNGQAQGGAALLAGIAAFLLMAAALVGSAGVALRVGAGLASPVDAEQPWRRIVRGGLALLFSCIIPGLGWFVIAPLVLAAGFGAIVLARWVSPRRSDVGGGVPDPTGSVAV
ncbi:MAG: hypothetical protein H0V44_12295 [Planctomycetes bacterium]|nr:hypothetical protein [Planctomycetota bacterium]